MPPRTAAALDRLYQLRQRRPSRLAQAAGTIGGELAKEMRRVSSDVAAVMELWQRECPELVESVTKLEVRGRQLHVKMTDSSMKYRLAQWLRAGGESKTLRAAKSVRRIRV